MFSRAFRRLHRAPGLAEGLWPALGVLGGGVGGLGFRALVDFWWSFDMENGKFDRRNQWECSVDFDIFDGTCGKSIQIRNHWGFIGRSSVFFFAVFEAAKFWCHSAGHRDAGGDRGGWTSWSGGTDQGGMGVQRKYVKGKWVQSHRSNMWEMLWNATYIYMYVCMCMYIYMYMYMYVYMYMYMYMYMSTAGITLPLRSTFLNVSVSYHLTGI